MRISPETDKQHQEDIDEGLSARKAVRIVESMPDKIQHIHGKLAKRAAAVRSTQPFLSQKIFLHARYSKRREIPRHRSKYLASGPDRSPSPHFRYGGRSYRRSGNRKSTPLGNQSCRMPYSGAHRSPAAELCAKSPPESRSRFQTSHSSPRIFLPVPVSSKIKCDEIKHQKQAGHDGNIVVGQKWRPKGSRNEHSLLFPHKTLQSVNDQREEENAVQPHDIPAVRRHISGQRIENPEKSDTQNTVFTVLF